jgi:hypothetical protein
VGRGALRNAVTDVSIRPRLRPRGKRPADRTAAGRFGRVAPLLLTSACGVALVSLADALSRAGLPWSEPPFWLGLMIVFVPIVVRLTSAAASRNERVALVLLLAGAVYLVKVLRDPFGFTASDELVHQFNVLQIIDSGGLFAPNWILPVTPQYPGLESFTAALASTSGISTFASGLLVIALARAILTLALFLLYEAATGSARVAGLATALYVADPQYFFFLGEFSYESLALPLALLGLFAVLRARPPRGTPSRPWTIVAVCAIPIVVVTHHLTSYGLLAVLIGICVVPAARRRISARRPWRFAAYAAAAIVAWLTVVASQTVGYLSPVVTRAISSAFHTVAGKSPSRQLFHSSTGYTAPTWEHVVGIAAAVIVVAAMPLGLAALLRRHRDNPVAVVLGVAGVGYVVTFGLRLVPGAWETAARTGDALFIGVALLLALAAFRALARLGHPAGTRIAICGLSAIVLMGGVVASTSTQDRLGQPYRVAAAGGTSIEPPSTAVARWAREVLGPGNRIAAREADSRLLMVYGRQHVFAGSNPPIDLILDGPVLYPWQVREMQRLHIRYVVVDAYRASTDVSAGYAFHRRGLNGRGRFPERSMKKFERAGARRIYQNDGVIVDDIKGMGIAAAAP